VRRLWLFSLALILVSGWALGYTWGSGSPWAVMFLGTTIAACGELVWCDWLMCCERLLDAPGGTGGHEAGKRDD
jgi:hypothetical protein